MSLTKRIIEEVWKEVFVCDIVQHDENFFELGGHSLTAAKIVSKFKHKYNINLSVSDIFDFPTINQLSREIERGLAQKETSFSLKKCDRSDFHPLSFAQKRLWFLYELRPDLSLYSIPMKMTIIGIPNIKALQDSLNYLMKRHEGLRTRVKVIEGEAYQEILPEDTEFPFYKNNILDTSTEKFIDEISRPFDLEKDILCRCFFHRIDRFKWTLSFVFHHIIFDDWSMDVFARELSWCYQQAKDGKTLYLNPLNLQSLDFSVWQNKYLDKDYLKDKLKYWKKSLSNATQIQLPCDKHRPKLLNYQGKIFTKKISSDLFFKLKNLSTKHQVSLFIIMLTSFKWALSLFTNLEDIIVGSPVSNRPFSEQKDVIGYFINILVFRTVFCKRETFLQVLEKVKTSVLKGYDAQEVPFEKILDELNISRELNKNPLFQVMFSIAYESEISIVNLDSTKVFNTEIHLGLSKFDLSLHTLIKLNSIDLNFEYLTELFYPETIEYFSNLYIRILKEISKNSQCTLSQIAKKFAPVNSSSSFFEKKFEQPHISFEKIVKDQGDVIAISTDDVTLTYFELNLRANALAYYLKTLGIGSTSLVCLCTKIGIDFGVAVLAIFKCGGRCLPVPWNRKTEILHFKDFKPNVILTSGSELIENDLIRVVRLDQFDFSKKESQKTTFQTEIASSSFQIYSRIKNIQLTKRDVIFTDIDECCEDTVCMILSALIAGSRLVIPSFKKTNRFDYILNFLKKNNVSVAHFKYDFVVNLIKLKQLNSCELLRWMILLKHQIPRYFSGPFYFESIESLTGNEKSVQENQVTILDCTLNPVLTGATGGIHIDKGSGFFDTGL